MEDPQTVKLVMEAVNNGLLTAAEEARKRAMDFETVAMLALEFRNSKKNNSRLENVIREKVKQHKSHLHFVWDDFLGDKNEQ
jgi:hypothetical protein